MVVATSCGTTREGKGATFGRRCPVLSVFGFLAERRQGPSRQGYLCPQPDVLWAVTNCAVGVFK